MVGLILDFQMIDASETQLREVTKLFFPSVTETTVFICSLKQLLCFTFYFLF